MIHSSMTFLVYLESKFQLAFAEAWLSNWNSYTLSALPHSVACISHVFIVARSWYRCNVLAKPISRLFSYSSKFCVARLQLPPASSSQLLSVVYIKISDFSLTIKPVAGKFASTRSNVLVTNVIRCVVHSWRKLGRKAARRRRGEPTSIKEGYGDAGGKAARRWRGALTSIKEDYGDAGGFHWS
jgi:hypothetical protein